MKLTAIQKDILKRVVAGESLFRSEFRHPYSYFFRDRAEKPGFLEFGRVSAKSAGALMTAGFIAKGEYDSALRWKMKATPAGIAELGPDIKPSRDFPTNKPIQVTGHFVATRLAHKYSIHTKLAYHAVRTEITATGSWIDIMTSPDLDGKWPAAKVNWTALGSVLPDITMEFAEALKWSAEEALRMDKEVMRRQVANR